MRPARLLVATLEGAMLLARSDKDTARFRTTAKRLLAGLGPDVLPSGEAVARTRKDDARAP